MGLYDRDYTNNAQFANEAVAERDSALVNFVKTTYKFFGASLFFAFVGAMFGFMYLELVVQYRLFIFIAEIAALFGLMFSRSKPGLNIAMLFIALIVVVVCSLVNLFLGSSMFQVLISSAAAILFSLYVAYDTQNIIRGLYTSPVDAAINLYLDFYNIFVSLLSIIGFTSRD